MPNTRLKVTLTTKTKLGAESTINNLKVVNAMAMKTSCKQPPPRGGGTLGISGWGCAAGTLEPLSYTRASSAEFCYPILE